MTKEEYKLEYCISEQMAERLYQMVEYEKKQAIAEHEAQQWKKYQNEKPEKDGFYLVTRIRTIGNQCFRLVSLEAWVCEEWITLNKYSEVIAFRKLPEVYREGSEK